MNVEEIVPLLRLRRLDEVDKDLGVEAEVSVELHLVPLYKTALLGEIDFNRCLKGGFVVFAHSPVPIFIAEISI